MSTSATTAAPESSITASETISACALQELSERYLLANTPGYLFRHYSAHPSVHKLNDVLPADQLVREAERVALIEKDKRRVEDVALAYACLVALYFHSPSEVRRAIAGFTFPSLKWAENVLSRATESPVTTGATTFRAQPARMVASQPRHESNQPVASGHTNLVVRP